MDEMGSRRVGRLEPCVEERKYRVAEFAPHQREPWPGERRNGERSARDVEEPGAQAQRERKRKGGEREDRVRVLERGGGTEEHPGEEGSFFTEKHEQPRQHQRHEQRIEERRAHG